MEFTRLAIAKFDATADPTPLQKALEAVPQVETVEIDANTHQAVVAHEGANLNEMTAALKSVGYTASTV
ncbi:MAG TPA: heavy metal-associated domain-containing protein [Lacunisphaera sp.]|nr:heavy metal-associated domain-containing protein [Lacunisphaera sp.]